MNVELGPVQETLLIPLLGRAVETERARGLLRDPKAVEIVEALDYDFDKWRGIRSLLGACIRARMVDEEVARFLDAHPDGSVVEIGAGLNTRYERLDNGRAPWLELDLPDSMALRRHFFQDTPRRRMVVASVLDEGWRDEVARMPQPVCFVSEAVLIYLEEAEVEGVVRGLVDRFPGAWFVTDTVCKDMVDNQDKHDALKTLTRASWFRWACDDPASLEGWGMSLATSRSFLDAPHEVMSRLPLLYRVLFRRLPFLVRRRLDGYRISRFVLGA